MRIVLVASILMLAGCVTVRTPSEQEWPMLTEEGIIANEKDFLWHQLGENIDFGMTKEEVIERCGEPRKISKTDKGEVWSWNITALSSPQEDGHEVNIGFWKVKLYFDKQGILYSSQVE